MTTIRLFCANGFSTAMMCQRIQEAAISNGDDFDVKAFPYSSLKAEGPAADMIVLGPQIRYNLAKTKKAFPDKPIVVMDALMYGQMDGEGAYKMIKGELGA